MEKLGRERERERKKKRENCVCPGYMKEKRFSSVAAAIA